MPVKCTMLFQLATNLDFPSLPSRRLAGWSESWYFPGSSIPSAIQFTNGIGPFGPIALQGLCPARAALLPPGAAIVGQRFQVVSPTGPSQTLGQIFPGSEGEAADIPQQALLITVPSTNANNIRRSTLRGIPDARVVEGEFQNTPSFNGALNTFFNTLGNFLFRGRDLSQSTVNIVSISPLGVVTCEANIPFLVNDMVRVLRTRTADGDLVGGRFQVASVGPGSNVFTLLAWTPPEATTGGRVRKDAIVYVAIDSTRIAVNRCVTRRVGRPFTQYRGRRSRRTL